MGAAQAPLILRPEHPLFFFDFKEGSNPSGKGFASGFATLTGRDRRTGGVGILRLPPMEASSLTAASAMHWYTST